MLLKLLFVLLFAINVMRCDDNNGMVAATENVEEYQNKENYYDDDQPSSGEQFIAVKNTSFLPTIDYRFTKMESEQQQEVSSSGERIAAVVHVQKAGAAVELKPTLVGLANMAITFLPTDYHFVKVESAQREVLNGIRYTINVLATTKDSTTTVETTCQIIVMEKPWLLTEWGDKQRTLQHTNCTNNEDEFESSGGGGGSPAPPLDTNDFNFNPVFINQAGDLDDEAMRHLESQIFQPTIRTVLKKPIPSPNTDDWMKDLEKLIVQPKVQVVTTTTTTTPSTYLSPEESSATNRFPSDGTETTQLPAAAATKSEDERMLELIKVPLPGDTKDFLDSFFNVENASLLNAERNANADETVTTEPSNNDVNNDLTGTTVPVELSADDRNQSEQQSVNSFYDASRKFEESVQEQIDAKMNLSLPILPSSVVDDDDSLRQYVDSAIQEELGSVFTPTATNADEAYDAQANKRVRRSEVTDRKIELYNIEGNAAHPVIGGPIVIPNDDPEMLQLVNSVLDAVAAQSDGNYYNVLNIIRATRQLVAGYKYEITGTFSTKNKPDLSCKMDIVWVLWRNVTDGDFFCDKNYQVNIKTDNPPPVRVARKATSVVPGGQSEIPIDDAKLIERVNNGLATLTTTGDSTNKQPFQLTRIESASRKTVSGYLYTVRGDFKSGDDSKKCTMTIWSRAWLGDDEITLNCDGDTVPLTNRRVKRATRVGGPVDLNVDDPKLIERVNSGLTLLAGASSSSQTYRMTRILSASKKTVAGSLYKVKAEFKKGGDDENTKECKMEIWSRPWLGNDEITLVCNDEPEVHTTRRTKRSLLYDPRVTEQKTESELHKEHLFTQFVQRYGRVYRNEAERAMRQRVFRANLFVIEQLNFHEQGTAKYGITDMADMTSDEYKLRAGLRKRPIDSNALPNPIAAIPNADVPREFDWRDRNVITPVKNQGSCGSCWAFSVTGNIEGLHAIKTGKLEEYSEQELVDCDTMDNGCNGGLPDNAYKAIEQLGGLELESEYPYSGKGGQCHFNKTMSHVQVTGAVDLPKNETAMLQYLVANGPLSIGLNANAMQFYKGGVSHPWRPLCMHNNIDHGVLIVGYGVADYPLFNKTLPYWIIKNSWGESWGERGYYRLYRGDNTCGVNSMASSAVLE